MLARRDLKADETKAIDHVTGVKGKGTEHVIYLTATKQHPSTRSG